MTRVLVSTCAGLLLAFATASSATESTPYRYFPEVLGQDGRITLTPAFTPDGKSLYFAQSECSPIWECPQRLKRSTWGADGWSPPETLEVTERGRVDYPSVTPDGRFLLFSWAVARPRHADQDVYEDFDLYRLDLNDPAAVPEPIDDPDINRIRSNDVRQLRFVHNETAPQLTRDGDLYFWTERLDEIEGRGDRDIYIARSDGNGGFLSAVPLPAPINSPGQDDGSWIHPNGKLMLVTYSDRGGQGDADLFVSIKQNGQWSDPANLGPTVNSGASDFAAMITPDGRELLFSSTARGSRSSRCGELVWTRYPSWPEPWMTPTCRPRGVVGAGERNRTVIFGLGSQGNNHYTTPAQNLIMAIPSPADKVAQRTTNTEISRCRTSLAACDPIR